jgi:hypothetical protein
MLSEKTATLLGEGFVLSEMQLVDLKGGGVTPVRKLNRVHKSSLQPLKESDNLTMLFKSDVTFRAAC